MCCLCCVVSVTQIAEFAMHPANCQRWARLAWSWTLDDMVSSMGGVGGEMVNCYIKRRRTGV